MAWKIADRTGKIFIDHNMNRSGANISAADALRPEPRAPVSTPLTWDEVARRRVRAAGLPYRQRLGSVRSAWATCSRGFAPRASTSRARTRGARYRWTTEAPASLARHSLARPRGPCGETSAEVGGASKDPALFEYVARRDFGSRARRAGAGRCGRCTRARPSSTSIGRRGCTTPSAGAARRAPLVGGADGVARPSKGDKRLAVQTEVHPLEYGPASRARSPGALRRRPRSASSTTGGTEPGRMDRHEGLVRAARPPLPGARVPPGEDPTDWLALLASAQRPPAVALARPSRADAGRGRLGGVRRRGVVVRAQARRHPLSRRAVHRRDRRCAPARGETPPPLPRAAHGARAGRPGERPGRRRDRRVRREGRPSFEALSNA